MPTKEPADKDLDRDLDEDLTEDDEYEDLEDEDLEDDEDLVDAEDEGRSARTNELWADARIDPIEIALPGGVGYTLRAYRPAHELAAIIRPATADVDDYDAASAAVLRGRRAPTAEDEEELPEFTDEELTAQALAAGGVDSEKEAKGKAKSKGKADEDDEDDEDEIEDLAEDEDEDEDEDEEEEAEEEEEEAVLDEEETPVFLGRNGRVYLFHNQEKLVEFVKSGAEHDLTHLETWNDLVAQLTVDDVEPLEADRYELDLVVENLRGGPDAWDSALILKAGELARDVGFGLRIEPIMIALSAGSPLDDLDEALRAADQGGIGSFFAKRRLKKIPAQQSSLAWRTLIGKISAAADWRD